MEVIRTILVSLGILLIAGAAQAATIYVDVTNTTGLEDGSEANPFNTIQEGIDAAQNSDTVLVADGTYTGQGNVNLNLNPDPGLPVKNITVKSENGPANSIIDCENVDDTCGFCFCSGETSDSVVDGFSIRNGNGGISCSSSSPMIVNNIIIGNWTGGLGGGISCSSSSPVITNNIIKGNSANDCGGGISCCDGSSPTITSNIITGNSTGGIGGGIYCYYSSPATIANNLITANLAYGGGGIHCDGFSSTITSNTITGNSASVGGGIYCRFASSPTITNTTLWNNSAQEIYFDSRGDPNTVTISYSDVQGGQAGVVTNNNGTVNWLEGNISRDPLFVDATNGDYHLSNSSPCIGAGIMTQDAPDTDIEGNPRPSPLVSNPDIGAYENALGAPSGPHTIHVATTGNDTTGDGSQANPYGTIQKGIDSAFDGDTVLVADGTYTGAGNINLDFGAKAITVRSLNGAGNCIVDCAKVDDTRGFHFHSGETSDSIVDGFVIRSGKATGDYPNNCGGGIACTDNSSPTILNNIVVENSADYGGGIYCESSSPIITRNVITANLAGGGICCRASSSPKIVNNIITENENVGIDCSKSSPIIINNTITGNSDLYAGGGIACFVSSPTIVNTILWNNDPWEVYSPPCVGPCPNTVTISYSDIQGGQAGIVNYRGTVNWLDGNMDADPLFIDAANGDHHLSDSSPCIGAGIATQDVPNEDIEGNPRPEPLGSNPDIGAYENSLGEPVTLDLATSSEDILLSDPDPVTGDTITIRATVHNTGSVDVDNVNVCFRRTIGCCPPMSCPPYLGDIGSDTIDSISAGGTGIAEISTAAEGGGLVYESILVWVDPDNAIPEIDETNNFVSFYLIECNTQPSITVCPHPVTVDIAHPRDAEVKLAAKVEDPDGDALSVKWDVDDGAFTQVNNIPASGPPTSADITLTHTYPLGQHAVTITVDDGMTESVTCSTTVTVQLDNTEVEYWAVIVDVPDDEIPYGNRIDILEHALLRSPVWKGDNIKSLREEAETTKAKISYEIGEWLPSKKPTANDVCLLFLGMHGSAIEDSSDPDGYKGLLASSDCEGDILTHECAISDDELSTWLEKWPPEATFVMINACRSGAFIGDIKDKVHVVFTSCDATHDSYMLHHAFECGYLPFYVIQGLFGCADADLNCNVSAEELIAFAIERNDTFHSNERYTEFKHDDGYSAYELDIIPLPEPSGIQKSIEDTPSGGELELEGGVYNEHVIIRKPMTIRSDNTAAFHAEADFGSVFISADEVTINGLTFINGCYAVYIDHGNRNKITNNGISAPLGSGIYLVSSDCNEIGDNTIADGRIGIQVDCSNHNILTSNAIEDAINILSSDQNQICQNSFSEVGIVMLSSDQNQICQNSFEGSQEFRSIDPAMKLEECVYNEITGNSIAHMSCGISLWSAHENTMSGNEMSYNWRGVWIRSQSRGGGPIRSSESNYILGNSIVENDTGIEIEVGSHNRVHHNNLIKNEVQAKCSDYTNSWDHDQEGNHWSDYEDKVTPAEDKDEDGIWDRPYPIADKVQDNFPFVDEDGWLKKGNELTITILCPVDMVVTDPSGRKISKAIREIHGAVYTEEDLDGDSDLDDKVTIPRPLLGNYSINVVPEPEADLSATYTLGISYGEEATTPVEDRPIPVEAESHDFFFPQCGMELGWNLISIPVQLSYNIDDALDSKMPGCSSVWTYEATDTGGEWKRYVRNAPKFLNTLETIDAGKGYWVLMDDSSILTLDEDEVAAQPISLKPRWNLVGYNCLKARPIGEVLPPYYNSVWTYDVREGGWKRHIAGRSDNNLEMMEPGKGYWVDAITGFDWNISGSVVTAPASPPVAAELGMVGLMNQATTKADVPIDRPGIPCIIWGSVEDNGVKMTGRGTARRAPTVILKVDDEVQSSYQLGTVAQYGDYYVLDVPATTTRKLKLATPASSARIELYVQVEDTIAGAASILPGRPGETMRLDLYVRLIPRVSLLYQNYPNPCNPDTWIPYRLREDAHAVIRIYTATGQLVRTLNLGRKPAGFYTDRERAAHWDGRNEAGERVASGVYFYSIEAGDLTATRKMTIMR